MARPLLPEKPFSLEDECEASFLSQGGLYHIRATCLSFTVGSRIPVDGKRRMHDVIFGQLTANRSGLDHSTVGELHHSHLLSGLSEDDDGVVIAYLEPRYTFAASALIIRSEAYDQTRLRVLQSRIGIRGGQQRPRATRHAPSLQAL